jgi:hypothetical protein
VLRERGCEDPFLRVIFSFLLPATLWCRGLAHHPFKVEIAGSNPARVAKLTQQPSVPSRSNLQVSKRDKYRAAVHRCYFLLLW